MKSINSICTSVLLLLLLQECRAVIVYTVTPDDHYYPNTTCHHCCNLQHYLLNTTKYFTSNTQLLFLPGVYHLHTNLTIQNVHNISLIGNGKVISNVTIRCEQYIGIAFINITNLVIANMVIQQCSSQHIFHKSIGFYTVLFIKKCSITLNNLHIHKQNHFHHGIHYAVTTINAIGQSRFSNITCYGIYLYYNESQSSSVLLVDNYHQYCRDFSTVGRLMQLEVLEISYKFALRLSQTTVKNGCSDFCISCETNWYFFSVSAKTEIKITSCSFINISSTYFALFDFESVGTVQFINCHFFNNNVGDNALLTVSNFLQANISNCTFYRNNVTRLLQARMSFLTLNFGEITLENVNFSYSAMSSSSSYLYSLIELSHTQAKLMGNIVFDNNVDFESIISLHSNCIPTIKGKIIFSNNVVNYIVEFIDTLKVFENTEMLFYKNVIMYTVFKINKKSFPLCIFQYYTQSYNKGANYSISFYANMCNVDEKCYKNIPFTDCRWLSDSLFVNKLPFDVNKKYIQYTNDSGTYDMVAQSIGQRTLCLCRDGKHPDCSFNELSGFPGQDLAIYLYHNAGHQEPILVASVMDKNLTYIQQCIPDTKHYFLAAQCSLINYPLLFTNDWCAILLKAITDDDDFQNIFYVTKLPCPAGFLDTGEECVCHPQLVNFGVLSCNIDNQTILRPANSWISATPNNKSYIYHISPYCPFHYCNPLSLHLNLSNPDSQCQFNRSGALCGECYPGLSTTFASLQCQQCSNVYLFLIIPISIAGLALILLLFLLNLTVSDGAINAFILYLNITGINASVLFQSFSPAYTLTLLANLDLGVQTCFYNGMDDYVKMWLQLAFPFYLIIIAASLIITSRYFTTVQRLTARRALPVLATLFLLSYTKILHTVSSVLFSYSTIILLPSEQSTIVWSVDANIPLLSFKFIVLFITCLVILLLIQLPFSIVLIFNRPLRRFRYVNKFKPLLDTYQGPYKDRFHYWTGLHLVIRVLFLGTSTLNNNTRVLVGVIIVSFVCAITGIAHPFKNKFKNYHEILLFLNLQILYILVLSNSSLTFANMVISMAAVHFTLVLMYHTITYMCSVAIRNKIQQGVNTVIGWMTNRNKTDFQRFELANVPEVTFNYREYREPLVAQD